MQHDLLLLNGTTADGSRVDIAVVEGRISKITPSRSAAPVGGQHDPRCIDLDGGLVLPALVNGHAHLDKTFVGSGWQPHRPGTTVPERVAAEREIRDGLVVPVALRAAALVDAMVDFGTGAVRTHVDIDPVVGLTSLEAILELREAERERVQVQVVAFPQSGILASPGVEGLLAAALAEGADVIGGLDPAGFDADAERHLDIVFDLASTHGAGVDIHLHELGESAVRQYLMIARRARAHRLQGQVVVSHAYGLGSVDLDAAKRVGAEFAEAGVAIMTNGPAGPMPPVLALRAEGATVFSGSDNIRDAWWPYGDGDMLTVARQVAYQSNFRTDGELIAALDLVTGSAAAALGLKDYGVHEGARADLLVVDSASAAAAIAASPTSRLTIHGGRVVGRTRTSHDGSAYTASRELAPQP